MTKVGIDIGNYDSKSEHTKIPSSFQESVTKNELAADWIEYNGKFYCPTEERNNQQIDKTKDGYCLVITLLSIAKELMYRLRKMETAKHEEFEQPDYQALIDKIKEVTIGVGLPIGIYSSQAKKMHDCYMDAWKDGVKFTYNGYHFHFKLADCKVFPQDLLPVTMSDELELTKEYSDYYIIGMGGGTVDLIPVSNQLPLVEGCISLQKGTTSLYQVINADLQRETGNTVKYKAIEGILMGKKSLIDEDRQSIIRSSADRFTKDLIKEMIGCGLKLKDEPCIFIGGGALLLKEYLEKSQEFVACEFIEDVNANAKFYAAML